MQICTVIARNYLAHARVLTQSFLEHHPDGTVHVLVLDDLDGAIDDAQERFHVVRPSDLPIEPREWDAMATIYGVLELSTAVKPWLFRHLFAGGATTVTYLDPDIQVFAPLDDVEGLAAEHAMVLVPHRTAPIPRDGRYPSESDLLISGLYNLGFIALASTAYDFVDWWADRLRRDCLYAAQEGMFVDQRWVDLASTIFEHHVLHDGGANVAYWNLDGRDLAAIALRFFHFSGFDPRRPDVLSKHQRDRPRVVPADDPVLERLCTHYAALLLDRGYEEWARLPYRYDRTTSGTPIDPLLRRAYRLALLDAEARGHDAGALPDPFDPAQAPAFDAWSGQVVGRTGLVAARRAAKRLAGQTLRRAGVPPEKVRAVRERLKGARPPPPNPPLPAPLEPDLGVNVAGYFRTESGVGEIARLLVESLREANVAYAIVENDETLSRRAHTFADPGHGPPRYGTNIVCVNADGLTRFAERSRELFEDRYTIGVWAWEVEEFPPQMRSSADLVDEIWVYSRHAATAVAPVVAKPVLIFPVPVPVPLAGAGPGRVPRAELGLPDRFTFLFSFDFLSVFERKNPLGLVESFTRAFEDGEGPHLMIKSINGDLDQANLDRLRGACDKRGDIELVDGYIDHDRQRALVAGCDAYVSLHRSEGFGLTMAEAMALGKPTIATGYSGNLEFMTPWNSELVSYALVSIPEGCDPYPAGARWAEPDLDAAAAAMRRVAQDPAHAAALGSKAQADMRDRHNARITGAFLRRRLGTISSQ